MDVKEAISRRRAYRDLVPVEITDDLLRELGEAARLAPSCFNNQPWKFVFARSPEALAKVHATLKKGNEWVKGASLIAAAFARKENDCVIKEREYYLFDLGQAVAMMDLRAVELGLATHPIAGFDNEAVRVALGIPEGNLVLTLVIFGKKGPANEEPRPPRLAPENIYAVDAYNDKLAVKPQR